MFHFSDGKPPHVPQLCVGSVQVDVMVLEEFRTKSSMFLSSFLFWGRKRNYIIIFLFIFCRILKFWDARGVVG